MQMKRDGLLLQNREGLLSLLGRVVAVSSMTLVGYLAIFKVGTAFARAFNTFDDRTEWKVTMRTWFSRVWKSAMLYVLCHYALGLQASRQTVSQPTC